MSITKIGDRRYRVRVEYPRRWSDGARSQKSITINGSLSDAKDIELKMRLEASNVDFTMDETLESLFLSGFLQAKQNLATSTVLEYKKHMSYLPNLMRKEVRKITALDIDRAFIASGKSQGTLSTTYRYLRSIFNYLERKGLIDDNPIRRVEKPKAASKPVNDTDDIYSDEEIADITIRCRGEWWEPTFLVMAFGGLRPQEAYALRVPPRKWDGVIRVESALKRAPKDDGSGNEWVIGETKTPKSKRNVQLDSWVSARILDTTKGRAGLITHKPGNKLDGDIFRRDFMAWCIDNGVRYLPPERLRHAFYTTLIDNGVSRKTATDIGGWTTDETMFRHYLRSKKTQRDEATVAVGERIADIIKSSEKVAHS